MVLLCRLSLTHFFRLVPVTRNTSTGTHSSDDLFSATSVHKSSNYHFCGTLLHTIHPLSFVTTIHKTMTAYSCPSLIAPSLLSCDLAKLAEDAQQMLDMGADWLVRVVVVVSRHVCHSPQCGGSTSSSTTLSLHSFYTVSSI